jgi:hypothetical protein
MIEKMYFSTENCIFSMKSRKNRIIWWNDSEREKLKDRAWITTYLPPYNPYFLFWNALDGIFIKNNIRVQSLKL